MPTASFGTAEFFFGHCDGCEKQVLTYSDFGPGDSAITRCLHCDAKITAALESATRVDLETKGYTIIGAETCGSGCPVGGCGAPKR